MLSPHFILICHSMEENAWCEFPSLSIDSDWSASIPAPLQTRVYRAVALLLALLLLLFTLVCPLGGKSSRKTGESKSSLPTSVNCRGLWLATWGGSGLLGSMKVSAWPNNPPVLWGWKRKKDEAVNCGPLESFWFWKGEEGVQVRAWLSEAQF